MKLIVALIGNAEKNVVFLWRNTVLISVQIPQQQFE